MLFSFRFYVLKSDALCYFCCASKLVNSRCSPEASNSPQKFGSQNAKAIACISWTGKVVIQLGRSLVLALNWWNSTAYLLKVWIPPTGRRSQWLDSDSCFLSFQFRLSAFVEMHWRLKTRAGRCILKFLTFGGSWGADQYCRLQLRKLHFIADRVSQAN